MIFNRIFLGGISNVDIDMEYPLERIKLSLSECFQNRKPDYLSWLSTRADESKSLLSYSIRDEYIKIYITKQPIMRFSGKLERTKNGSRFIGNVGVSGWMWSFYLGWFAFLLLAWAQSFFDSTIQDDRTILLIFSIVGIVWFLTNILGMRKSSRLIKQEITDFLTKFNIK